MSINKHPLVLLLILITSISSCVTVDKSVGDQFVDDDQILKVHTETLPIDISNALPDSIQAISTSAYVFGHMTTNTFGTTKIGTVAKLTPLSDSVSLGKNPKLVSATMTMTVDSSRLFFTNDEGMAQNLYLYKLKREIDTIRLYNYSYGPEDFEPIPVSVGAPVYNGAETIEIQISDEYANELLATTDKEFLDFDEFYKRIKGLYFTTESPESLREGGRLNYMSPASSFLTIKYLHTDPEKDLVDKDTTTTFIFGRDFGINISTPGSGHLTEENPTDRIFVDGFAGVKPYVKGEDLRKLVYDWASAKGIDPKNIIFSKASVVFPYETPDDQRELKLFHKNIYACTRDNRVDSVKSFFPIPEVYEVTSPGGINHSQEYYSIDMTSFLQDLMVEEEENITNGNNDVWFMPVLSFADDMGNVYFYLDDLGYRNTILNGNMSERRPYLKFVYAVMK